MCQMSAATQAMLAAGIVLSAAGQTTGDFSTDFFVDQSPTQEANSGALPLLSRTLGSNMVLQRAPQRAVVWGFAAPGTQVRTTLDGSHSMSAKAGEDGVWRQLLPAVPGSSRPHSLTFSAISGETAQMDNVLFGDLYLCGGQSNMQFSVPGMENASQEAADADAYPLIRVFTVGQKTRSGVPLQDLKTVMQTWSVANRSSIARAGRGTQGAFVYFSAVCWVFGREIFKELGGNVPIGLISNNWGGTPVEHWSTPESLQSCNVTQQDSVLFNAMIHPYTVGPMSLVGFTWYQGESNTGHAESYACMFPAMISAWRQAFQKTEAYFGFIQLSTWCAASSLEIAEMRSIGQMAALSLPKVGYATNADHGAGCQIHPPAKQYCAKRLAQSALALQYGKDVAWKSPSFQSQAATASPPAVSVRLNDVSAGGLRSDQYPYNYLNGRFKCGDHPDKCAWASLLLKDGSWVNATIEVTSDGHGLTLSAPTEYANAGAPVASAYAWGAVPMMSVYDKQTDLPLLPWNETVSGTMSEEVVVV